MLSVKGPNHWRNAVAKGDGWAAPDLLAAPDSEFVSGEGNGKAGEARGGEVDADSSGAATSGGNDGATSGWDAISCG